MTEIKHDGLAIPGRVVLAHELPFRLARAQVVPATRQIEAAGRTETLEPRVMQVLVVLARATGAVVTRDELIDQCWEGRAVSDDAINRVISRLRQIGAGIAGGTFTIETITKVGYRLAGTELSKVKQVDGRELPANVTSQPLARRSVIMAGVAAAAVTTAGVLWRVRSRHQPPPQAIDLYRRGDLAQRVGTPSQARQAISYLEQSVQVDPDYAAGWGALALAYTHTLDGFSEAQMASIVGRIQSAATRALALDPDNADAQLALVSIRPFFGHWLESEARLRDLVRRYPDHWLCHGRLGMLLRQVGRQEEAFAQQKRVIAIDPMIPPAYGFAAMTLSNAGRIQEADAMLKQAEDRWPAHPMIWQVKYNHLLYSGRPKSAAAFVMDPETLPSGVGPADVQPMLQLAKAVDTRDPHDVEDAVQTQLALAKSDTRAIYDAAPIFALLGRTDLTFAALDRYFLNQGAFGTSAPITPATRRNTDMLFSLPMSEARNDERFAHLTARVGLDEYWHRAGPATGFRAD